MVWSHYSWSVPSPPNLRARALLLLVALDEVITFRVSAMPLIVSVVGQVASPVSDLTAMSVNELNEGNTEQGTNETDAIDVEEADDEDDDVNPLALTCIWDDAHLVRQFPGTGKHTWKCCYCKTTFSGHNATKALAHVTRTTGQDIAICKSFQFISCKMQQSHLDLYHRFREKKRKRLVCHEAVHRSIDEHQQHLTAAIAASRRKKRAPVCTTPPGPSTPSASVVSKSSSTLFARNVSGSKTIPSTFLTRKPKLAATKPPVLMQLLIHDGPNPNGESGLTAAIADMIHSVGLPFSLSTDPKFRRVIKMARNVGSNYVTPTRQRIGSELLELNYNMYISRTKEVLLNQAEVYGLTLYGDGATVKKMPLINILCAGVHNPAAVLEIVNCSSHLQTGGKKDASYIADLFHPHLHELDPSKTLVDLVYFDGA